MDHYEELLLELEEAKEKGDFDRVQEIEFELEEIVEKYKMEDT